MLNPAFNVKMIRLGLVRLILIKSEYILFSFHNAEELHSAATLKKVMLYVPATKCMGKWENT